MATKTKTLRLSFPHLNPKWDPSDKSTGEHCYRVEQVTDSTSPSVGSFLSGKEVDDFCAANDWKVTVVHG